MSKEANHAPAPWVARGKSVWANKIGSELVCSCDKLSDPKVEKANAKLIAAAPDLKSVVENFELTRKDDGLWLILHGNGTGGRAMFNLGAARGLAGQVADFLEQDRRAAIAKATGKESA